MLPPLQIVSVASVITPATVVGSTAIVSESVNDELQLSGDVLFVMLTNANTSEVLVTVFVVVKLNVPAPVPVTVSVLPSNV